MMQVPVFKTFPKRRETYDLYRSPQMLSLFGGYDRRPEAPEGTWHDQLNMSTWGYPALSTRRHRMNVSHNDTPIHATAGLIEKDAVITIDGENVVINGYTVSMGLSTSAADCPKKLISMGAYLLVWPDKKYLNTQDFTDKGSMEQIYEAATRTVRVSMCKKDGSALGTYTTSASAPESPQNGDMWMDTSNPDVPVLKEWSETSGMWVTIPTTYLKIRATGIGTGFSQYDGVEISGFTGDAEGFNGSYVIQNVSTGYLVVTGIMTGSETVQSGGVTVSRTVPDMDFVTECDNRIWGCKYGLVNGKTVNEIYASKLGDFKNWKCYMGLATDSYAAGRGTDGVFTGAITFQGHPMFFREDCIEKVFPSSAGAHQIVTVECRGVQEGCWRSLAIANETLFWKNRHCVCAYTGSLPVNISEELGRDYFDDARAGAAGGMYYISMRNSLDDTWHFFTYDVERRIWNREDDTKALMFTERLGRIYFVNEADGTVKRYYSQSENADNRTINWSVTSNVIGHELTENEYISRFVIRCETKGSVHLEIRYDEETETVTVNGETVVQEKWHDKGTVSMNGLGSFVLPVAPRRCDHLRYRISGNKPIKIYSITKHVQTGSDVHW